MIGEVASVTRLIGAALAVLSGTATNIATLALTPGDWGRKRQSLSDRGDGGPP